MTVILGVLMVLGGLSMMASPLTTFISTGYMAIILFFVWGIFGVIKGFTEKRYKEEFWFSIISLILGIVGLAVPGAANLTNTVMLYLAAGWIILHGVLTLVDAFINRKKKDGTDNMILGIFLGIVDLCLGIYAIAHPAMAAVSLGFLMGLFFAISGVSSIIKATERNKGSNGLTLLFTILGILMILGGVFMLATPIETFASLGYCIILLFFLNGILGIARGFIEKQFEKGFFLSILSLILGVVGLVVPGAVELSNSILLYLAAGWFIIHGVMSIINAIQYRQMTGTGFMVMEIILGVLEVILGGYSFAHPAMLAISLGLLVGFYFIESGVNLIFIGSSYSKAVEFAKRIL